MAHIFCATFLLFYVVISSMRDTSERRVILGHKQLSLSGWRSSMGVEHGCWALALNRGIIPDGTGAYVPPPLWHIVGHTKKHTLSYSFIHFQSFRFLTSCLQPTHNSTLRFLMKLADWRLRRRVKWGKTNWIEDRKTLFFRWLTLPYFLHFPSFWILCCSLILKV